MIALHLDVTLSPHFLSHLSPQVDLPPWSNTRQNYESPRPGEFSRADSVVEVQIKLAPTVELCNSLPYALQVGGEGVGKVEASGR